MYLSGFFHENDMRAIGPNWSSTYFFKRTLKKMYLDSPSTTTKAK